MNTGKRYWAALVLGLAGCHVHLHVGEKHYYGEQPQHPTLEILVPEKTAPQPAIEISVPEKGTQ